MKWKSDSNDPMMDAATRLGILIIVAAVVHACVFLFGIKLLQNAAIDDVQETQTMILRR